MSSLMLCSLSLCCVLETDNQPRQTRGSELQPDAANLAVYIKHMNQATCGTALT